MLTDRPAAEGGLPPNNSAAKPLKSALKKAKSGSDVASTPPSQAPPLEDDFMSLTKRFEALKKR